MAERPSPATERLYEANTAAARFYAGRLHTSKKAADYLDSHGITPVADPDGPWQLGYAPGKWTELATHLQGSGFSTEEVTAAGLGFIHSKSGHLLDRFRDRLMFPITDDRNQVVAFTARDLSGRSEARWMNTPETSIYRKRLVLYGLGQQLAHRPAGAGDPVVFLVEGAADVLAMHRMANGYDIFPDTRPVYAVAPCGTNLTREQLTLLERAMPNAHLILAFDGDDAGRRAISRVYPIAVKWPGELSGASLPAGQDPADVLATLGPILAINEIVRVVEPLAQIQLTNTIKGLFGSRRITDPAKYTGDRITAYRAIAELFIDAGGSASRAMAEAAAEQLGLDATDVVAGVIEAWRSHDAAYGADPPPDPAPPPATSTGEVSVDRRPASAKSARDDGRAEPSRTEPDRATVWASARRTSGRGPDTVSVITRHDPSSGITVWALADGIGQHPEAATTAAMAADIAATVTLRSAPAAGLHAARAAINAFYDGVHASQAGDASLILVSAYPSPTTRHGVRFELAWAGDCRAYTIRAGELAQLTADHTTARQRRDLGEFIPAGSVADLLLTSSVRAGDISVCPLEQGPLLVCNAAAHRGVPSGTLAGELAGMSDAQASADRLLTAARAQVTGNMAVLLIHARCAPPSRVTTTGPTQRATLTATGSAAALAKTSFASPGINQASAAANTGPSANRRTQPRKSPRR